MVGPLAGTRVLDLYAGSGAVGLEALSRGAEHVLLVEHGARAVRVIRQNIEALGLPGAALAADRVERVLARGPNQDQPRQDQPRQNQPRQNQPRQDQPRQDQPRQDQPGEHRYDVVFADPPYAMPAAEVARMLTALAGQGWLVPGALVIVERATRSGPLNWPDGFVPDRARRYGEATFWYGHAAGDGRDDRPGASPRVLAEEQKGGAACSA